MSAALAQRRRVVLDLKKSFCRQTCATPGDADDDGVAIQEMRTLAVSDDDHHHVQPQKRRPGASLNVHVSDPKLCPGSPKR